jgi:Cft2 family RNA processing exonuclease
MKRCWPENRGEIGMELTFLGGAAEVGASCTLLQVAGHRILIDGGIRPAAREGQPRLPDLTLLDQAPPEALLITHAHIDHTGALPLIASLYPNIPIFATESTRVLTELLLRDSVRIMEQEGLKPDGEIPLYSADQVDALLGRIQTVGFLQPFAPIASIPTLTVRFLRAGHIMGAAMLFFETPTGTLLHTGDISVTDQRTIKGLKMQELPQADVMVCEGTYGNRTHATRKDEERKLAQTVQAVLARGGRILCPAFAVGRAQEVVLILKAYRASGQISPVPIYIDGMVRSVCNAYQVQSHDLHSHLQRYLTNSRRPLFADPSLHVFAVRSPEREALAQRTNPMIVISSSGMLTGGASPLYAAELAAREQDCILFTGYQDEESPGAALLKARTGDVLRLGEQSFTLTCQVARYNLSGHADAEQILDTIAKVNPRQLILVHGAPESLAAIAQHVPKGIHTDIPTIGTRLKLAPDQASSSPEASAHILLGRTKKIHQNPEPGAFDTPAIPPTIEQLWQLAFTYGPLRPWTAVELGQQYYGPGYKPVLRSQVEQVLKEASPYFKIGRVGAQPTYLPRPHNVTVHLRPISQLSAGEVVLVQGHKALPQIALLLSAPTEGTVTLVADAWKPGTRPINLIQLIPHLRRDELLTLTREEVRTHLQAWRKKLDETWLDLFVLWKQSHGQPFTFASLCTAVPSDDLRLAWGLELLAHASELFRRDGSTFTPFEEQRVLANPGFAHHLQLLEAPPGSAVLVNDRRGRLTGRSNWRVFEICYEDSEGTETHAKVRSANVQLLGGTTGEHALDNPPS